MTLLSVVFAASTFIALGLDFLLFRENKSTREQLQETTQMFERMVSRQVDEEAAESKAHRAQIDSLLVHIQAPEIATIPTREEGEPQYVAPDDWKGFQDYKEQAANGGAP